MGPLDVAAALAKAAAEISGPQDLDSTLATIVGVARDSMPVIDHVGISVLHGNGEIVTMAATDDVVRRLDLLQYDLGEGPCLHAIDTAVSVRVENARHEQRWPRFIPAAVAMGLRSQLGLRLDIDQGTAGALNLYSVSSDVLDDQTLQLADLFAAHVALALGHARRLENLNTALASRQTIGLALGILMERLDLDVDARRVR